MLVFFAQDESWPFVQQRGLRKGEEAEEMIRFIALRLEAADRTRWPCSHGKVSTTRWAGLTSPASIAAAA